MLGAGELLRVSKVKHWNLHVVVCWTEQKARFGMVEMGRKMIDDGNEPRAWKILAENDERGKYILIDKMYFAKEQDEGESFSDGNAALFTK